MATLRFPLRLQQILSGGRQSAPAFRLESEAVERSNPSALPEPGKRRSIEEPYIKIELLTPKEYIGALMELAQERRVEFKEMNYMTENRASIVYELPLAEMVGDFFDQPKSRSMDYASMEYSLMGYMYEPEPTSTRCTSENIRSSRPHDDTNKGQIFTDVVGSPYYVAPEVLCKHYGPEADVWTAGVILYILLSGVPPFWAETQGIFDAVLKGVIDFDSDPWPLISDSAKDLIRKMLTSRPSDRMTAHEVLCHPWICEHGVAPDRVLDPAVLSRLKQFSAMNKLKKMALRVIAESLSEEEIAGLKEMFQAMDTDNSGAITFDELKAGLRRYGSNLKESEIRALMDAADVDNSGTIDYGEFIAATVHLNKLEREEHLVAAFAYFDKDGSGYITVDELQQACKEHNMSDVFLEDVIKEVDQDNDGRIDYGEFVAMMRKGNIGNMGLGMGLGRRTMRNSLNVSMTDAPGAR